MLRVLLVEDDDRIAEPLVRALGARGYIAGRVGSGAEAVAAYSHYDLVLLDMGLPDRDGISVCRDIRESSDIPIIAVTARREEGSRVSGLRAGADDYVVKPFGLEELIARMEAVSRRAGLHAPPNETTVGDVEVDLTHREVRVAGEAVTLARKEFDLLAALAGSAGRVVTRESLMESIWNTTWVGSSRTLDVHVATLRSKLGRPELVETVRGVGYRLTAPAED